jgi:hypothetical protein
MRAFASPKIPRSVGRTRNSPNAYVSHNRRTRFLDVAIATPCQFFDYSQGFHGQSLCSPEALSAQKSTHTITR